jgi:hypothetical protein
MVFALAGDSTITRFFAVLAERFVALVSAAVIIPPKNFYSNLPLKGEVAFSKKMTEGFKKFDLFDKIPTNDPSVFGLRPNPAPLSGGAFLFMQ